MFAYVFKIHLTEIGSENEEMFAGSREKHVFLKQFTIESIVYILSECCDYHNNIACVSTCHPSQHIYVTQVYFNNL